MRTELTPPDHHRAHPTRNDSPTSQHALRPFLGAAIVVRTVAATWHGTLLSCVKDTAWMVVDDADIMIHLEDIVAVRACPPGDAVTADAA